MISWRPLGFDWGALSGPLRGDCRLTSEAERKRLQRKRKAAGVVVLPPLPVSPDYADEFSDYAVEVGLLTEIEAETNRSQAVVCGAVAAWEEWLIERITRRAEKLRSGLSSNRDDGLRHALSQDAESASHKSGGAN